MAPFAVVGKAGASRKEEKVDALVRLEEGCLGLGRVACGGCLVTIGAVNGGCSASLSTVNQRAEEGEMAYSS